MTPSRRDFLRNTLLATACIALRPIDLLALGAEPGQLSRGGPRQRILILGAGMAGLTAAYELLQAGHEVVVLEARTRSGGRVRTLRAPFTDGMYAEAGAARIPRAHELVIRYIEKFSLPTAAFESSKPDLYRLAGRTYRSDQPDLLAALGCTTEEQELGATGTLEKYLRPLIGRLGDMASPGWPPAALYRYDDLSSAQMLRQLGISEPLTRFYDVGLGILDELSGLELLMQVDNVFVPKLRIVGGTDLLPRAMARELGAVVRYGTPVCRIEQDASGVRVAWAGPAGGGTATGDRIICTIPFSVLRGIEVQPPFQPAKQQAVDHLYYEAVTRVYVQTRTRFWEREGVSGYAFTDDAMEIWPAGGDDGGERAILLSYTRAKLAEEIARLGPDDGARQAVELMSRVYPELPEQAEGTAMFVWNEEPWARGAYTGYLPGQMRDLYAAVASPAGRIFFAGEHCSPWPGWIQGAVHSGVRAALEVNQA